MELIVVGTDGSPTATEAVGKAIELAKQGGSRLAVVSAYKPLSGAHISGAGSDAEAQRWQDGLSDAKVEAVLRDVTTTARSADVEVEVHRRKGDAADAILAVAKELDADLIVVGNQGMTGARRVLGSVPNKITHHAP